MSSGAAYQAAPQEEPKVPSPFDLLQPSGTPGSPLFGGGAPPTPGSACGGDAQSQGQQGQGFGPIVQFQAGRQSLGSLGSPSSAAGGSAGGGSQNGHAPLGRHIAPLSSADHFCCSKCALKKPIVQLRIRSGQRVCECCVRAYASIQTRWTGNRELREWFKALTPSEKQAWYVKQLENDGVHRKVEDLIYAEASRDVGVKRAFQQDHLVPWRIYRRNALMDGESAEKAAYEFIRIIQDNRINCEFDRGEWHVPEYQGIFREVGRQQEQGLEVKRQCKVDSKEALIQLTSHGRDMMSAQLQAHQQQAAMATAPARLDTPMVPVNSALQPAVANAADHFDAEMEKMAPVFVLCCSVVVAAWFHILLFFCGVVAVRGCWCNTRWAYH